MSKMRKFRIKAGTVKGAKGGGLHLPGVTDENGKVVPVAYAGDVIETDLDLANSPFADRVEELPASKKIKATGPSGTLGASLDPNFPTTPPQPPLSEEHNDDEEEFEDEEKKVRRDKTKTDEDEEPLEEEDDSDDEESDEESGEEDEDEEEPAPKKKVKKTKKRR